MREVLRELRRRRVRSALTATGIAIGVAALVLLGALAEKMDRLVSGGRDFATGQITVSGAGSGIPVYESEINSLVNQLHAEGIQGNDLDEATAFIKQYVEALRSGANRKQFEAAAIKVQNKKWYPMLHVPPKDDWQWEFFKGIYNYNSADYWAKVSVPTLVIYGERDQYRSRSP